MNKDRSGDNYIAKSYTEPRNLTHGETVKRDILAAGLALWPNATARAIGRRLDMSHSAILYHWGSMETLKTAIAIYAIEIGDSRVVSQLITACHPSVSHFSEREKVKYVSDAFRG